MGLALAVLALRRAVAIVSVPYFSAYSRIVLLLIYFTESLTKHRASCVRDVVGKE